MAAIKANTTSLKDAATVRLKAAEDNLKNSTKVFDMLSASLKSLSIESTAIDAQKRREAQAYLKDTLADARAGGKLSNATGLEQALSTVGKNSTDMYATFLDYARDQASTIDTVGSLQEQARAEKDVAQLTVDAINATIAQIELTGQSALDAAEMRHQKEMDDLDKLVENSQAQLDALNGLNNSLLSLAGAIAAFKGATAGVTAQQTANNAGGGVAGNIAGIESLYQNLLGRSSDAGGLQFWQNALNNGLSLSQITAGFTSSDEYKKLHPFADGTNYIPHDMPAYLHEGEAVIPKADNRALMSSLNNGSNNGLLISEIKALRQEVVQLRQANTAENTAIQRDQAQSAKVLKRWDGNGLPATMET